MKPQKLKELRNSKGLSQAQLAVKVGVSTKAIQSYEQGLRIPPLKRLVTIAELLGVDPGELI